MRHHSDCLPGWMTRVRFPAGAEIFHFATTSRPTLGPTQLPLLSVRGALSFGLKCPDREADHSPASNAEVKIA